MQIRQFIDADKLTQDLTFTETAVNEAMMSHAGQFAHYATLSFEADNQANKAKQVFELTVAKVDSEIRAKANDEGRKVTEALMSKEVEMDKRVVAARKASDEAKAQASLTKLAVEAFRQRKDMLVQVASNRREEYKGQVRLTGVDSAMKEARDDLVKNVLGTN